MQIKNHWLTTAEIIKSPNYDERPDPEDISLLVIHCISLPPGEYGHNHISRFFCNQLETHKHPYFQEIQTLKVSAHLLIQRNGHIQQFVPFNKRAWHAGVSRYHGRERCNDFSIGIELEGTDTTAYQDIQYQKLAQISQTLFKHYPKLSPQHITGHSDIAPGRKTDPGSGFDWKVFYKYLRDFGNKTGSTVV